MNVIIPLHRVRMELGRVCFWRALGQLHLHAAPRLSITYAYGQ